MSQDTPTTGQTATMKPRVAVLFGGRSSEHAVSCVTAAGVLGAINKDKYEVIPIGIAKTGQWVLAPAEAAEWSLAASSLPEVVPSPETVTLAEIGGEHQLIVASPNQVPQELGAVDVVFPLLHGPFGEDGTIQGLLELSDTRYVGAGVLASAVGMDKHYMKVVFEAAGLHVGPYVAVTDRQWRKDPEAVRKQVDRLGFPVFVKPARAGSSMGISKVDSLEELDAAIEEARRHDLKLVILDYLQLMSSGKKVESRQQEVSEFSRALKLLAKELQVPVIALSQLNRGSEQRQDKRPMVSDLRESGSIEQDADMVILLHREDVYDKESPRAGEADILVAKHRNGPTKDIVVAFQGHYSRFANMAGDAGGGGF